MKLDAFRFRHVGPFGSEGVSVSGLRPGLNVVSEHNERGKSSLLSALETVLFLPHTSWKGPAKQLGREDGAPMGEIDFTVAGTHYRLSKTFRTGKTAALTNLSTGAIVATKREAEERVAEMLGFEPGSGRGPSGLLWVRQGNSMEAAQDDGQVASRLESELSTLVGGDRARAYLERTEAELGELLTRTGRVKTGGPLQLAEDRLAATEAQLERAQAAADQTRQLGLDLQAVEARIASLQSDTPTDAHDAIERTRAELSTAREARGRLDALRADAARRAAEGERADDKLAAHMAAVQGYDQAQARRADIDAALEDLARTEAEAQTRLSALGEELSALSTARERLERADRASAIGERLAERNAALQDALANLDALQTEAGRRADLVATRDGLAAVTRGDLDALSRLEREREATARDLAGLQVTLILELDTGATATLDGKAISSGPVRVSAASELSLPGGRIRMDAPEAEQLRSTMARLENDAAALLEKLDIESAEAGEAAMRERAELDADIALIDRQIGLIAPDGVAAVEDARDRLATEVERLSEQLNGFEDIAADTDTDPATLARELNRVEGERRAERARAEQLGRDRVRLEVEASNAQRMLANAPLSATPSEREAAIAALSSRALLARQQGEQSRAALDEAQAQAPTDPALIEARLKRLLDAQSNRQDTLSRLEIERTELSARRRQVFDDQDPEAEAERLAEVAVRLREDVAQYRLRANALSLLRDTLRSSQSALQDRYTAPVRAELAPLLSRVITGAEAELSEHLGPTGLRRSGGDDPLERLSGGTQEQIAVLTRLAFARLLARGGQPCPVILDDALVYADDGRREAMFDVLNYVAAEGTDGQPGLQLLYLSCHARATETLGGHVLQLTPWPLSGRE